MPPIRVAICSGIRLYRDGLAVALRDDASFEVVVMATTPAAAARVVGGADVDVVLVDVTEHGVLAQLPLIAAAAPQARLVALAVSGHAADVVECAEAGALGYVTRDGGLDELRLAIEGVHRGRLACPPEIAAELMLRVGALAAGARHRAGEALTAREREIAELAGTGLSNKQIAHELRIELATVKNHMHAVLAKLQISRRGEIGSRLMGRRRI